MSHFLEYMLPNCNSILVCFKGRIEPLPDELNPYLQSNYKLNDASKMRDASKRKNGSTFKSFLSVGTQTAKEPEPPTKQTNTVYQIQINVLSPCQL